MTCHRNKRVDEWRPDTALVCFRTTPVQACLPRHLRCFGLKSSHFYLQIEHRWYIGTKERPFFNTSVGQSPAVPRSRECPRGLRALFPPGHEPLQFAPRELQGREENHRARPACAQPALEQGGRSAWAGGTPQSPASGARAGG